MPMLAELQADFRRALLDGDESAVAGLVEGGTARLDIHRNNLFASLGAALADTFPAVCRLVDPRFFAYATHEFVRRAPPRCAVLAEYGADFADFLADFPPCRGLAWLPDVARLEWLMARAACAADATPLAGVVLEIKFTNRFPSWVEHMVRAFGLKQERCSKFAASIEQMLARGGATLSCAGFTLPLASMGARI